MAKGWKNAGESRWNTVSSPEFWEDPKTWEAIGWGTYNWFIQTISCIEGGIAFQIGPIPLKFK